MYDTKRLASPALRIDDARAVFQGWRGLMSVAPLTTPPDPIRAPRPRVLIVDDDELLARSYARALSAEGYDVETRLDGESAVDAVQTSSFDVVLSDVDMPRLSGVALLERIRACDLDIPVVLITGNPSLETAVAAVEHGALRYMTKPVEAKHLHTRDLLDDELFDANRPLARIAAQVVLEITERASLHHIRDVQSRIAKLREMGFRIAVDDLGAGYAGLTSFAQLEPEVVKLDMSLVRDVHTQPTKQTLVRTMIAMCKELGMQIVAEGIETPEERDVIVAAGCDLMQGYLFAKPGKPFPAPAF